MTPPILVTILSPFRPNRSCPNSDVTVSTARPILPRLIVNRSLCMKHPVDSASRLVGRISASIRRWNIVSSKNADCTIGKRVTSRGSARQCNKQVPEKTIAR